MGLKVVYSKRKEFAHLGNSFFHKGGKLFLFRVGSFSLDGGYARSKQEVTKVYSLKK